MKIGSVVAVKPLPSGCKLKESVKWYPIADEKTPYVIRGIDYCNIAKVNVYFLEEGIIGYNAIGKEMGIEKEELIELLPPQTVSIDEIIQQPAEV